MEHIESVAAAAEEERSGREKEMGLLREANVSMRKYGTKLRTTAAIISHLAWLRCCRLAGGWERWRSSLQCKEQAAGSSRPPARKALNQSGLENRAAPRASKAAASRTREFAGKRGVQERDRAGPVSVDIGRPSRARALPR